MSILRMRKVFLLVAVILAASQPSMAKPVANDFDNDGKSDPAIYRAGMWFVLASSGKTPPQMFALSRGAFRQFGRSGDIPISGDFSGDGRNDFVLFAPLEGKWYFDWSNFSSPFILRLGNSTDIPGVADFDADGRTDVAFYRPSTREYHWRSSKTLIQHKVVVPETYGVDASAFPVPGYYKSGYNGAKAGVAFRVRASNGSWNYSIVKNESLGWVSRSLFDSRFIFALNNVKNPYDTNATWESTTGLWRIDHVSPWIQWGLPGDKPIVGDYDGDGIDDIGVWRPSTGTWFVITSSKRNPGRWTKTSGGFYIQWGLPNDIPLGAIN